MKIPFSCAADLPACLTFAGEFGAEVNSFLPLVYWLHQAGLMRGRRIRTYRGMRPFYFFLDVDQIEEVAGPRHYVPPQERPEWMPVRNDHLSTRTPFLMFPDYRKQFRDGMFNLGKPLLIVHNKVTAEWGRGPINVFSLGLLDKLFSALSDRFHIVYLRPGLMGIAAGYSVDHQPDLGFDDLAVLRAHSGVEIFDEMAASLAHVMSYNETKLRLYAHADFHITVQGGNAHLLSLFSGGMAAILHIAGQEVRHSYAHGHFGYASSPPPRWLICRSETDVERCIPLFRDAVLIDGQPLLPADHADTVRRLSPRSQRELAHA